MVYMSACEQCCRLCNNSIPFKVYNEKFRGATYITVFDGVCQNTCNVKAKSPYLELRPSTSSPVQNLPVIAGDPVTVVKICCDCVNFCRIRSNNYGKLHLYHNYIYCIHGHNPSCISKPGICWSDLFCWISRGFLPFTHISSS